MVETRAVVTKRDGDQPSSTLSVVPETGLTASMSSGDIAKQSMSPTKTNANDPQHLDFIGSSKAVKKLFGMSLDVASSTSAIETQNKKKTTLLAIHNFDGTLIIDDAEDESNYEVFRDHHEDGGDDNYHVYKDSLHSEHADTTNLLPPSSQSLALALSGGNTKDVELMLSNFVQESSNDDSPRSQLLPPPTPPRDYVAWQFQDLNMLLGHDALVVRSKEQEEFAVRVEDARVLRSVWEAFQQRQQRSYAQALLQENDAPNTEQTDSTSDVPLQTCIVPFTHVGGKLSSSSSSTVSTESSPALSIVLDAYLDNLMANVPQLALCLQEKGLIQSVKMLPTEEIPSKMLHPSTLDFGQNSSDLEETIFSPQIMETNASALLRFLKTNCTKNHATYLLRHEEGKLQNIQLYDISAISTQKQKKWIWWLATMSYRFALRLRHLESSSKLHFGQKRAIRDRQRSLLQQTLDLLQDLMDIDGKAHESMVASVREHMADTYLNSAITESTEEDKAEVSASPPSLASVVPAETESKSDQPYATVSVDALNKAQDHLVRGIKTLSNLYEEELQQPKRSRRRRQRSEQNAAEEEQRKLSPAIVLQLFGMNFKLVNISLRLAEHHLGNYYSSSAMQALRTAAKRLNDAAKLLDFYNKTNNTSDEKRHKSLQLQYIWLLEHCGHFARSFASDELWRDRGHVSGEDVISVLTDVETVFETSLFWDICVLRKKSKGTVSLQSLSGVVAPSRADHVDTAIRAATDFLKTEALLRRERRRVLVASCILYSRAITAFSRTGEKTVLLDLLRQRLGDACNETGKILLAALRTLLVKHQGSKPDPESQLAAEALLDSAEFWFTVGLEAFGACGDTRNLALLRCNLCQSFKLRANSGFKREDSSSPKHAEDCLQKAADQLLTAHEDLGVRDTDPQTWDMVSEELAATFLVLGVRRRQSLLGSGNAPVIFSVMRLSPGEERSIVDPMERALKIYEQSNAHQAAAVHYQLALTFSKLWTCQLNETNTRKKLSKAFEHYSAAFDYFSVHSRGNEPTFCLLCLDLASLYAAIPGEEGLLKSLGCCLDCCDTFSSESIRQGASSSKKGSREWYETMETIAQSVDDRVFKLLRSLVKADPVRFKEMYRKGLTAKMVRNVPDEHEESERSAVLLGLHEVLLAVKKTYGIIVAK